MVAAACSISEPGHRLEDEFVTLQLMVATAALGRPSRLGDEFVVRSDRLDGEFDPLLSMVAACGFFSRVRVVFLDVVS
jgi:hypothetical protein